MHIHCTRYFLLLLLLCILFSLPGYTQNAPAVWGEIPNADLEMKSYPADTNAAAVILYEHGDSYITERYNNIFTVHTRIKILTPQGYPLGTRSFIVYKDTRDERVRNLEGCTYWLNDQNEIMKSELQEKDILIKDIDNRRKEYWFTLPALKPGCVLEFRYTIISKSILFHDWVFQQSEPVRYSEYKILFPREIGFSGIHQGSFPYTLRDNRPVLNKLLYSTPRECTQMRWVVENAPALRPEPYMTSIEDYVKKVSLQLSGFAIPGYYIGDLCEDWAAFATMLKKDEDFGKKDLDSRVIRETAARLTGGLATNTEKMKALYSWVAKNIVCSEYKTPYSWQDLDKVIEQKKGSNADINFLLLALLKATGLEGYPVILSTRSNGKISEAYPVVSQFNSMIVQAVVDSQKYYLDATEPDRPFNLLPPEVLNVKAIVFKDEKFEWAKLSTPKRSINLSAASIVLQKNGSISGTLEDMYRDYGNLARREDIKGKENSVIAKELFNSENLGLNIDSITVEGKDGIDVPLKLRARVTSSTYAQCNGHLIYFNPHLVGRMTENPLKNERRNFPLDYAYPRECNAIVNLTIPDSMEIHESVVSRSLIVNPNLASFSRKVMVKDNQIRVQYKWEIRETEIDTMYYSNMRDFYSQIIALESEQFVFSRIKPAVQPTSKIVGLPAKKKGKK